MGKGQNSGLDSWMDCLFGGPSHPDLCNRCAPRLVTVAAGLLFISAIIVMLMDYLIF